MRSGAALLATAAALALAACASGDAPADAPSGVTTDTPTATAPTSTPAVTATVTASPSAPDAQPAWEFPERVGTFTRFDLKRDTANRQLIAGYRSGDHLITVYVYPGARGPSPGSSAETVEAARQILLDREFAGARRAIETVQPSARLLGTGTAPTTQGGVVRTGRVATYGYVERTPRGDVETVTVLHLFIDGDWWVKYRTSYPASISTTAAAATATFIDDLRWPPAR